MSAGKLKSACLTAGLLAIQRRGQGKTNIYELNLKPKRI